MSLAVVLSGETLLAAWPITCEGPFSRMRPQVTSEVESTSECTATTGHRADELCFIAAAAGARGLGRTGRDLLFFDLQNGWQPREWRRAC